MLLTKTFVENNTRKQFLVVFKNETRIAYGRYYKWFKEIKLKFLLMDGMIYYKTPRHKTTCYHLDFDPNMIESMTEILPKDKTVSRISNAKKILKRIHPNAWVNIQQNMKDIISGEKVDGYEDYLRIAQFRDISKIIPEYEKEKVLKSIRDAFENKTNFSWRRDSCRKVGRDFSIECKMTNDGVFYAWFSSEYAGCLNGDYYLLINPTTAMYYEKD